MLRDGSPEHWNYHDAGMAVHIHLIRNIISFMNFKLFYDEHFIAGESNVYLVQNKSKTDLTILKENDRKQSEFVPPKFVG